MKRALLFSVLAVSIVLCGTQLWLLEGIDGLAASLVFEDSSEFASRYSDSAFRTVHSGMTVSEVVERLGEPLHRSSDVWFYSRSSRDSHFHLRLVRFEHEVGHQHTRRVLRRLMLSAPLLITLFLGPPPPPSAVELAAQARASMAADTSRARRVAERCVDLHPRASNCWLVLASACARQTPADEVCSRNAYSRFAELTPEPARRSALPAVDWNWNQPERR